MRDEQPNDLSPGRGSMNAALFHQWTNRAIADSVMGVPTVSETGIIERLLANPDQITFGTISLILLSFFVVKVLQPAAERISIAKAARIEEERKLVALALAHHEQGRRDADTMLDYIGILARGVERMADAVHGLECKEGNKPLSDTTLQAVQEIANQPRRRKPHHKPGEILP